MKKLLCSALFTLAGATAGAGTIEMTVHGMVCGFCAQGIEKSLRKHPATSDVIVSLENKLVVVETRAGQDIDDAALTKAIKDAGYDLKAITRTERPLAEIRGQVRQASK